MLAGSGTAAIAPEEAQMLLPKSDKTIVRSLISTLPSPRKSPVAQAIPAVWPKCDKTTVRSLISTLPSRLASPGNAGVRRYEATAELLAKNEPLDHTRICPASLSPAQ